MYSVPRPFLRSLVASQQVYRRGRGGVAYPGQVTTTDWSHQDDLLDEPPHGVDHVIRHQEHTEEDNVHEIGAGSEDEQYGGNGSDDVERYGAPAPL